MQMAHKVYLMKFIRWKVINDFARHSNYKCYYFSDYIYKQVALVICMQERQKENST